MIKNSYSFWGYLRLAIFVIRTKFISSKARIIRFPIEIRGKRFIDFGFNGMTQIVEDEKIINSDILENYPDFKNELNKFTNINLGKN